MKYFLFLLLLGLSVQFANAQDQGSQKSIEGEQTNTSLEAKTVKNALYSYASFVAITRDKSIQSQLDFKMYELAEFSGFQTPQQLDLRKNWSRWDFITATSK